MGATTKVRHFTLSSLHRRLLATTICIERSHAHIKQIFYQSKPYKLLLGDLNMPIISCLGILKLILLEKKSIEIPSKIIALGAIRRTLKMGCRMELTAIS